MPAVFAHEGVKFLYPDNWRIAAQSLDSTPLVIEMQSPGSAFWTLHIYPLGAEPATREVAGAFRSCRGVPAQRC